jgi:hypothetical protein
MRLSAGVPLRGSRQRGVQLRQSVQPELRRGRRTTPLEPTTLSIPAAVPPVRLRSLLVFAALALSVRWFAPRAVAYWQLHGAATDFANYALCMAGSGGPELLSRQPADFWRLIRRRLIASPPEARPFASCVPSVEAFPHAAERRPAHQAKARDFLEYSAAVAPTTAFSLEDLRVDVGQIDQLARTAQPLLATGGRELIVPSTRARSAPLLAPLPVPAEGRGLPAADLGYAAVHQRDDEVLLATGRDANLSAYRSRDGGRTWSTTSASDVGADLDAGHCSTGRDATSFRLGVAGAALQLESWQRGQLASSFPLAAAEQRLLAFSCDARAAVAVLTDEEPHRPATFRLCAERSRCRDLPVPAELGLTQTSGLELSAARVQGATILAFTSGGIVRVISSRDDGQTWTPPVVAYDAGEAPELPYLSVVPTRLLSLGGRALLYSGADRQHLSYAALASDDLGASWHAPR